MFFFFFFNNNIDSLVKQAFKIVCIDKLLKDEYVDMGEFILGSVNKEDYLKALKENSSELTTLYRKASPKNEKEAEANWSEFQNNYQLKKDVNDLTTLEAKAIVNWMYIPYTKGEEREKITKQIIPYLHDIFQIDLIDFAHGFIFFKNRIQINVITDFSDFTRMLTVVQRSENKVFYRGHSDCNYSLLPSIMRKRAWLKNENKMYFDTIIECPTSFEKCSNHLDYLVEMQHYGLPTRLLDITRNPLVALYFACIGNLDKRGEIIVFNVNEKQVKYPQSDTVSILSCLPLLQYEEKEILRKQVYDSSISNDRFNKSALHLLQAVKQEKIAFQDNILKQDVTDCFFVQAEKKNNRIIKQDGAFIICGLVTEDNNILNGYRYFENGKKQIWVIENRSKKCLIDELNHLSINRAQLFPEIQDVTEHIKIKYS